MGAHITRNDLISQKPNAGLNKARRDKAPNRPHNKNEQDTSFNSRQWPEEHINDRSSALPLPGTNPDIFVYRDFLNRMVEQVEIIQPFLCHGLPTERCP